MNIITLLDSPVCKSTQKVFYKVPLYEESLITCEVDADPSVVVFYWNLNNSLGENYDLVTFTNEGSKSMAKFTPRSLVDYGVILCYAKNEIGIQLNPCAFFILPAGDLSIELNFHD